VSSAYEIWLGSLIHVYNATCHVPHENRAKRSLNTWLTPIHQFHSPLRGKGLVDYYASGRHHRVTNSTRLSLQLAIICMSRTKAALELSCDTCQGFIETGHNGDSAPIENGPISPGWRTINKQPRTRLPACITGTSFQPHLKRVLRPIRQE
jgi:hypothetical protein